MLKIVSLRPRLVKFIKLVKTNLYEKNLHCTGCFEPDVASGSSAFARGAFRHKGACGRDELRKLASWPARVTVDELFACPENTVLDGPYVESEVGYSGFQSSDQGRYGMPTIFYQAFHGCYKSVNEIMVIGLFNYFDEDSYNWLGCLERGAIDWDYKMTEPVKFEIAFYRQNENGRPGELVFRQESDIVGRYLGITYGSGEAESPLYEFKVALDQVVKFESGFMSFSAVDMGNSPSCWFSVFTADTSMDYAYIYMDEQYGLNYANLPAVFSFMGDGSMAAQKALRVDKIANPGANANGTHEKVSALSLGAGESATVKASMNPSNLVEGMYESVIEIRSNDELKPLHIIPVYFANGIMTSIEPVTVAISETKLTAEGLSITADNAIADILVVDFAGRMVIRMSPGENSAIVPVESLSDGVYVLSVTYVDGSSESMKFALSR